MNRSLCGCAAPVVAAVFVVGVSVGWPVRAVAAGDPAPRTGSLPVGQASYPVPAGALHVAVTGSDANAGTAAAPLRTIKAAVAKASSTVMTTIVVHAGVYHESVDSSTKMVTIQNAPGEAVWLDGSEAVASSRIAADGSGHWILSGYATSHSYWTAATGTVVVDGYDYSPTFTHDAPDGTTKNWKFINDAENPMAGHPDQLWVGGVAQREVGSAASVVSGTFFVDLANKRIIFGTDPTAKEVRISTLTQAVKMGGAASVNASALGGRFHVPWDRGASVCEQSGPDG